MTLDTKEILRIAGEHLEEMSGHEFDVLTVEPPVSPEAAVNLSKIISKLSPILGNLIEFNVVEFLDDQEEFKGLGTWKRQDPGFPDAIFDGVTPQPGFEIKAWFPLSTEITARFKDSQNHFTEDNTNVCMLAWLPEKILYGKPRIVDVVIVSGRSVAEARDNHYHNPPHYLVLEPENTSSRTSNLQQTNTNGYRIQDPTPEQLRAAEELIASWGDDGHTYKPTGEYQAKLRELMNICNYRLDTNYAKMDRIVHPGLEAFKERVLASTFEGMTAKQWDQLFRLSSKAEAKLRKAVSALETAQEKNDERAAQRAELEIKAAKKAVEKADARVIQVLKERLDIKEEDAEQLLE
ncbi:hypothetical protein [Sulfitobacter dubius]|uniref:hypothetical protein n=1 Tax=Sulfitobacter dubius TaxID=218673 RepID=UPI0022AFB63F|nr:hypothetical protein [Sulfitobacter dubius]MCZ4366638.1 hypothetical protein [Sulfitobacter dubius]